MSSRVCALQHETQGLRALCVLLWEEPQDYPRQSSSPLWLSLNAEHEPWVSRNPSFHSQQLPEQIIPERE